MDRMIFVNLPVEDVTVSRSFYTGLGFSVNEQFSDDQVACIVVSETIFVMLLEHNRFRDFTTNEIADARTTTEVLNALSASSREEVDDLVAKAVVRKPVEDDGMYGHSFADPDGHVWEVFFMEVPDQA